MSGTAEKPICVFEVGQATHIGTVTRFEWLGMGRVLLSISLLFLLSLTGVSPASGQELACRVQVDDSQLSGSDYSYLDNLERQVQEYLNTRSWTDDRFLPQERISCSMQIVIQESLGLSEFRARLIVTARRPIHGTSQSTIVVRINDPEWEFEYSRGTSLNYDLDQYNALTSVIDFYAFILLGYDYDTFSALGGTEHFEQARSVADQAESSGDPGWSSMGGQRNRSRLITNLLDSRHRALRRIYYTYHLEGLDRFVTETEEARKQVLGALETLRELDQQLTRSYALDLFFSAKYEELAAFFAGSNMDSQAHDLLVQMDPSHSSTYNEILE